MITFFSSIFSLLLYGFTVYLFLRSLRALEEIGQAIRDLKRGA